MTDRNDIRSFIVDHCMYSESCLIISTARSTTINDFSIMVDLRQRFSYTDLCYLVAEILTSSRSPVLMHENATWKGLTQKQSGLPGSRT